MPGLRCVGCLFALLIGYRPAGAAAETLYLARRGWHVDIGFITDELVPPLNRAIGDFPGARSVFFGFGDRRYLESKGPAVGAMLEALWPGPGVLLATGLSASPEAAFGASHLLRFHVSAEQAAATQRFVWNSLTAQQAAIMGTGHAGGIGPYAGSIYLGATPTYWAGHTCNTWAAEALAISQPRIRSRGVLLAGQLWGQARRRAAPQSH